MKENELVLLLGPESYLVKAERKKLNTDKGTIDLSELKNKNYGDRIKSHTGTEFTIVKPNLIDILTKIAKRSPQVVTPKDASLILSYTGISPDSLIVDAGSGSGFLCIFLAYYCSKGKVVTYEKNPRFIKTVKENIKLAGLKNVIVKEKDILKGIDEKNVDLITLDMKNAEGVIKNGYKALKPGSWLVVYSPHIEQVKGVIDEIKRFSFTEVNTVENIVREWKSEYNYTRPKTLGILHTGWITFGRKF